MNPYIQYMYSYPHKTAYGSLTGVHLSDYARYLEGEGHGLYLHIPFCQTKCGYCNLFSVTGQGSGAMDRYLDAVERQSRQYAEILLPFKTEFSDLTIGGGTPLLLSEEQLGRMFRIINTYFRFAGNRDLVIETAPNQTTREKLKLLKEAGTTRVSMGVQSFSDEELRTLHRQHGASRAREALELLKSFDFPRVNVDFIYGIPGQTVESLLNSLREALSYEPDEIFLYPLYVKHGVKLEQDIREGMVLNPEYAYAQYREANHFLREHGFRQDSMRRFVRDGVCHDSVQESVSRENVRPYSECGFGTSLAIGCGGRSYLGNLHFCSPYAITREECLKKLEEYEKTQDYAEITHGILLSPDELKRRYVIRHLLIQPGLSPGKYQEHFEKRAAEDFPLLENWIEKGYLEEKISEGDTYLALTETGMGLSDFLGPKLISAGICRNMEEWEARHGQENGAVQRRFKEL